MAETTGFDWSKYIEPALGLLSSGVQANMAGNAAQVTADANLQAAKIAADAAAFRPVGVTTRFGRSGFQYDPQGRLIGAGYQAAPDVAAQREAMMGMAGGGLNQAQLAQMMSPGYFSGAAQMSNLGQQYLSASPEAAAQKYMAQQQALVAPQQEQALANLRNKMFQQGRGGLATGATNAGGMAATSPEMAAYYNALAQQNAQFAANANQMAQKDITFGTGLMGTATDYLNAGFGTQAQAFKPWQMANANAATLEGQAANALGAGSGLGSSMASAGANQANALLAGGQAAATALGQGAALQNSIWGGFMQSALPGVSGGLTKYFGGKG